MKLYKKPLSKRAVQGIAITLAAVMVALTAAAATLTVRHARKSEILQDDKQELLVEDLILDGQTAYLLLSQITYSDKLEGFSTQEQGYLEADAKLNSAAVTLEVSTGGKRYQADEDQIQCSYSVSGGRFYCYYLARIDGVREAGDTAVVTVNYKRRDIDVQQLSALQTQTEQIQLLTGHTVQIETRFLQSGSGSVLQKVVLPKDDPSLTSVVPTLTIGASDGRMYSAAAQQLGDYTLYRLQDDRIERKGSPAVSYLSYSNLLVTFSGQRNATFTAPILQDGESREIAQPVTCGSFTLPAVTALQDGEDTALRLPPMSSVGVITKLSMARPDDQDVSSRTSFELMDVSTDPHFLFKWKNWSGKEMPVAVTEIQLQLEQFGWIQRNS